MSLVKELKIQTVVLLAEKGEELFVPSQFSQYWLNENNIIPASEVFSDNSNFSPNGVAVRSKRMNLVVVPEQIQIASTVGHDFKGVVIDNCVRLLQNIHNVKYRGLGVNFTWFVNDQNEKITDLSRRLFYNPSSQLSSIFGDENAKFGLYLSKDITDSVRMKLDIRPVTITDIKTGKRKEHINCAFNFHSDLRSEDQTGMAIEIISNYDNWRKASEEILNSIN